MDRCRAQKVCFLYWRSPNGVALEVAPVGGAGGRLVYLLTRFLAQKPFAGANAAYLLAIAVWLGSELLVNSRVFLSHLSQIVSPLMLAPGSKVCL